MHMLLQRNCKPICYCFYYLTVLPMKNIFSTLIGLGLCASLQAQTQRVVLVEHFTQASCPPCASQNPALKATLDANFGKVIAIKHQVSWPGSDPMNAHNPTEIAARVGFYGVSGVPNAVLDGTIGPGAPNTIVTTTSINNRYAIPSPFEIGLTFSVSGGTITANAEVIAAQNITESDLKLHVVVLEERIEFSTPPGTNGEKVFENVAKKWLPNASGTALAASWTTGQSQSFDFSWTHANVYNESQLTVVAFIQSSSTKAVHQAAFAAGAPYAMFDADKKLAYMGDVVQLLDDSKRSPTSWNWTISPGVAGVDFEFVDGTDNTSTDPKILFHNPNLYNVRLDVSNEYGTAFTNKASFIEILNPALVPCNNYGNFDVANHIPLLRLAPNDEGFFSGHNAYNHQAKADKFLYSTYQNIPDPRLNGFRLYFGHAQGAGSLMATIWDNSGTGGAPGMILQQIPIDISTIPTDGSPVQIDLETPILITSDFYIGITLDYGDPNTSVALYTNYPNAMLPKPGTAWEQLASDVWLKCSDASSIWGTHIAHAILPDICPNAAEVVEGPFANEKITPTPAVLHLQNKPKELFAQVFPNPTQTDLYVLLRENSTEAATFTLTDLRGSVVFKQNFLPQNSASYHLSLGKQPAGVYMLVIQIGEQQKVQKIIID